MSHNFVRQNFAALIPKMESSFCDLTKIKEVMPTCIFTSIQLYYRVMRLY